MTNKAGRTLIAMGLVLAGLQASPAWAGNDPYVGQISWVAYNFAPKGWAACDGQLLSISQNTALFSLLGTQYGGDGRTTFALPDMRGRLLVNAGQGQGLANYQIGQTGGEEAHSLTASEMPAHSHSLMASTALATESSPQGNVYGQPSANLLYGTNPAVSMAGNTVAVAGGSQPHNNMMPYVTLNCIIALQGVFPPRP